MDLDIVKIYDKFLYSVKYEEADENEYDRLFQQWNDVENVCQFMEDNSLFLKNAIWERIVEPEDATKQVLTEARELEGLLKKLCENSAKGKKPDLDDHFKYLEGKYKYELSYEPMKSYGTGRPPLLRMYAIKMGKNVYLITGGGIKLADTIQNSPGLKDHVLQNIDRVRRWLKNNGVLDGEDMNEK